MSVQFLLHKYMVRVNHMKHMRAEMRMLRVSRNNMARRMEALQGEALEAPKLRARLKRLRVVAVTAVLACPGSFVAGGYLLKQVVDWVT